MKTHLQDEKGHNLVEVGDYVECKDARFFVGAINESQSLCILDKSKPWELLNENSPYGKMYKTRKLCCKPSSSHGFR